MLKESELSFISSYSEKHEEFSSEKLPLYYDLI